MIRFRCEQCGKKLKAEPAQAGARFKCSRCGTEGVVPRWKEEVAPGEQAAAAPAAAPKRPDFMRPDDREPPVTFGAPRRDESELDMTPMVDVTFLLLIFFMITAAFSLQKSLEVPKPNVDPEAVSQSPTLEELEEDDDFIIVHIDHENVIWVNDFEAPTRQELLSRLREIRESGPKLPQNLLVTAHGDCRHETVVMVLDVGNSLGIENIRLATDEGDF